MNTVVRKVVYSLVIGLTVMISGYHAASALSLFLGNLGWINLVHSMNIEESNDKFLQRSADNFKFSVRLKDDNSRSRLGGGLSQILLENDASALVYWEHDSVKLGEIADMADWYRKNGMWNESLSLYRGLLLAGHLEDRAETLAGTVCQRTLVQFSELGRKNETFCTNYFENQDGNLVVNSNFEHNSIWGWSSNHAFSSSSVSYTFGESSGIILSGETNEYHGGIFQKIAIPPSSTMRYGMNIKVHAQTQMKAELLYFGGSKGGVPFGNATQILTNDLEWTYVEREIRLPDVDDSIYTFFPVLFSGQGTIWIDNVKVELLP